MEIRSGMDMRPVVPKTHRVIQRNMSSPYPSPSGMPIHGGPFAVPALSPGAPIFLHSPAHPSAHQVRVEDAMETPLGVIASNRSFLQNSSQSHSPRRTPGVPPLRSSSGSPPIARKPSSSTYGAKSVGIVNAPHTLKDGMLSLGSRFPRSSSRTVLASNSSPRLSTRMRSVPNTFPQPTAKSSEKPPPPFQPTILGPPPHSPNGQPMLLTQEAVDNETEKTRHSIQHVLEQKMAEFSAQLEHVEMRWKGNAKHERQEREALSASARGDMETIKEVCQSLKALCMDQEASLKNASVQLGTSCEDAERMNKTAQQFVDAVGIQERKLVDLEAAMEIRIANAGMSINTSSSSSAAVVLSRVDELEKALVSTTVRTDDDIRSIDQPEICTPTAGLNDLSTVVSTCMNNVQQFERDLNSGIATLQGDLHRLEVELTNVCKYVDVRVAEVASQIEECSRTIAQKNADEADSIIRWEKNVRSLCAQEVKDLAPQIWHELATEHQEASADLSSRLNDAVSELDCRIFVQEEELSNLASVVSRLHPRQRDSLSSQTATPHFGQSSFSDRSSIAPRSSGGRPSTGLEFTPIRPLAHSQKIGSPTFSTPSPTRKAGAPECRIGELRWHDQDWDLEVCPEEEGSPETYGIAGVDANSGCEASMLFESDDVEEEEVEMRIKRTTKT